MKNLSLITFISLLILFSACSNSSVEPNITNGGGANLLIDENLFNKLSTERLSGKTQYDPVKINSINRVDDSLVINITYSGGCKAHSFDFVWDGVVLESYPAQIYLLLAHSNNGDQCNDTITETISIDLTLLFGSEYLDTADYIISIFSLTNQTNICDADYVESNG